ncbi:helix-turn-helix transcriptional regulator [Frankia gtarii]|uniref:helix-turn-helix transcriptional regulator n=1 Tax=Frankia gtarii TaxID=2950102 RepID=UPI0021C03BF5|nr:response regulator transcription factor [Frankia gtarii]
MPHPIRVLVRAGDPITQAGLAAQLGGCPDIEIVTGNRAGAAGAGVAVGAVLTPVAAGGGGGPAVPARPAGAAPRAPHLRVAAGVAPAAAVRGRPAGGLPGSADAAAPVAVVTSGDADLADVALVSAEAVDERTLHAVRELQQCGVPTVLVVAELDAHDLTAAVDAGAVGLLRRAGATPETVLAAVRGAATGEGYLPPDLLGPLLRQVRQVSTQVLAPRGLTFSGLSERELTVLRLVSEGLDTREIGLRLSYSERTVKNVLQDITRRFGLRNRSHAVAYAFRHGLL